MRDKTFYSIFVGGYKLSWSAFQTIDLEGYICSICEALSDNLKFTRTINAHNNETCSRNKSFSLDVIIFLVHVMLPLRTVSVSFPANHVHMPAALMNKQKANFLVNITLLELGN